MKESLYHGFRRIDFLFEDTEAILVFPEVAVEQKKWLLKMEYFDAFPDLEIEMVKRGYYLAYLKNITRWCLEEDLDKKKRFCTFLAEEYGLNKRCVPIGMSCGGLIGSKFAAKYPECVSVLYLDAPVLNLLSCPAGFGIGRDNLFDEFKRATGMTTSDLLSYREHPIDKLCDLVGNNIPVVLVYGEQDLTVPYGENGAVLEKYYKNRNCPILSIGKPNCGHHPHGLTDLTPIINFIKKYDK